jgi:hypothetical protein
MRGYQNTEVLNEFKYAVTMWQKEGVRSFYRGFVVGMGCRVPMSLI